MNSAHRRGLQTHVEHKSRSLLLTSFPAGTNVAGQKHSESYNNGRSRTKVGSWPLKVGPCSLSPGRVVGQEKPRTSLHFLLTTFFFYFVFGTAVPFCLKPSVNVAARYNVVLIPSFDVDNNFKRNHRHGTEMNVKTQRSSGTRIR